MWYWNVYPVTSTERNWVWFLFWIWKSSFSSILTGTGNGFSSRFRILVRTTNTYILDVFTGYEYFYPIWYMLFYFSNWVRMGYWNFDRYWVSCWYANWIRSIDRNLNLVWNFLFDMNRVWYEGFLCDGERLYICLLYTSSVFSVTSSILPVPHPP